MIDIQLEKEMKITAQNAYDIIQKAVDFADDEGFINRFVFERGLYIAAICVLDEDMRDTISTYIDEEEKTPLDVWYTILKDGIIDKFNEEYATEFDFVLKNAEIIFEDYKKFASSPRGMIESLSDITTNMTTGLQEKMDDLKSDERINETIDIANKWGMRQDGNLDNVIPLFEQ